MLPDVRRILGQRLRDAGNDSSCVWWEHAFASSPPAAHAASSSLLLFCHIHVVGRWSWHRLRLSPPAQLCRVVRCRQWGKRGAAEGEDWEETSQPWAGPCEGKSVELKQLLEALTVDVQAAVLADCALAPWSGITDVKDHDLQSLPPSQDYQTPSGTALLRSTFPQMLLNFTEAEAVKLMLLGLRDADAIHCVTHGFGKNSAAAASQRNPVDAVFRMAAHMSDCFTSPRSLVVAPAPAPQPHPLSTSPAPAPADGSNAYDAAVRAQLKHIEEGIISGNKQTQHLIDITAELQSKGFPSLLMLIPNQESGTSRVNKLHIWMEKKVMDRLLLVMQCEMRVATNKLPSCVHGVLWHRPLSSDPQQPLGYEYSQPKSSIKKLVTIMRYVTLISKVCRCFLHAFDFSP